MNNEEYVRYQEEQFLAYEKICRRCGVCCGSEDGDSCANLAKDNDGKFYCKEYEIRFSKEQHTLSGKTFHCVPIREIVANCGARPGCAYEKKINSRDNESI